MTMRRGWGRAVLSIGPAVVLALVLAGGNDANARELTRNDAGRIDRLEKSRDAGLRQAAQGDPAEFQVVRDLLDPPPQQITDPASLVGAWRCRTIKLGGGLPLVIYKYFDCRIRQTPDGLVLEKPTGSQRKLGHLEPDASWNGRLLYAGTSYYSYNDPQPYGSGPEVDEVGMLEQVDPRRLRLELPEPYYESQHDVIELRR